MKFLKLPIVQLALIAFLGVLCYSNTFKVPFVFDDPQNIVENPLIKNLSNVPSLFIGGGGSFASRPLMHFTFALNYHFGGLDTSGYHAVNLVLHLINGALLYALIVMTGLHRGYAEEKVRAAAFFSSLIFVVHPLNTDAVTYVVSRSALLAAMFFLLGLMLFLKAATSERKRGIYIAALFVASLMGMASRENFVTFPVVLFLYDLFFISDFRPRDALKHYMAYLPVLLSLGYMARIAFVHTYDSAAWFQEVSIDPLDYVCTQFNVQWTYLRLLVFPINQNVDHYYPVAKKFLELQTALSFIGYAGLYVAGIAVAKKRPLFSFALFWFLIILLPVSFLIAPLGLRLGNVIFEHRMYLPSIGLMVAIISGGVTLYGALKSSISRAALLAIGVGAVIAMSCATYARNGVWSSELSLWEDSAGKSPDNASAQGNLGIAYYRLGQYDKAISHFKEGLRLKPTDMRGYNNLALAYERMGMTDMAIEQYKAALRERPHYAKAHNNLGSAYLKEGRIEEAMSHFESALRENPDFPEAHFNLGIAYFKQNNKEEARKEFEETLKLDPGYEQASRQLLNLSMSEAGKPK